MFTKWLDIQPIYKNKSYIYTGETKMKTQFKYIYLISTKYKISRNKSNKNFIICLGKI